MDNVTLKAIKEEGEKKELTHEIASRFYQICEIANKGASENLEHLREKTAYIQTLIDDILQLHNELLKY